MKHNETLEINQPTTINISYAKNVKPVHSLRIIGTYFTYFSNEIAYPTPTASFNTAFLFLFKYYSNIKIYILLINVVSF